MKLLVNISRIIVGLLFIFSGAIKAIDPVGFSYKMEEYFTVFSMEWMIPLSLFLSIAVCILEIVVGIAVLIGSYMRFFAPLLLILILFFSWLTGWSAITGEVTDCGCFGDAIKLTPLESFIKDLILLVFILIIFVKRKVIKPLFAEGTSKIFLLISLILTTGFALYNYSFIPVIDFRPYKVGVSIPESMEVPPGAPQDVYKTILIYKNKKTGEVREFVNSTPPDYDNWEYVDRRDELMQEGYTPPIHDFSIIDEEGNDLTDEVLHSPAVMLVIAYNIKKSDRESFEEVVALAENLKEKGIKTMALTASPYNEIESLRHEIQAAFPFYYTDATTLKTIIRANPGLVLIEKGTIKGKWDDDRLPTAEKAEQRLQNQ